ncbi:MAG: hypothetical protein ACP5HS_02815 [Anaerolineae bacterium]
MEYSILEDARALTERAARELFPRRHVVACGIGYKVTEGTRTDTLSLVVSVTEKVPATELSSEDIIPQTVSGLPTDVVETGRIRAQVLEDPRARRRPAQPGISLGHRDLTAGTFGFLVRREGRTYILSNNHVIADTNDGVIGDPIYQPAPADGGTPNDRIATLTESEPLDFGDSPAECSIAQSLAGLLNFLARISGSKHRLEPVRQTTGLNIMDAALALPDQPDLVKPDVLGLGIPTGVAPIYLGQDVQKMGRTTGLTHGMVTQINVTVNVDYGGRTARFVDQVFASSMSGPGDSGSGILDMGRGAVGLLFAGSERVTIFTPIQRILDRFGVEIVTS